MVVQTVSTSKPGRAPPAPAPASPAPAPASPAPAPASPAPALGVRARSISAVVPRRLHARSESEAGDVIDLGAPRLLRRLATERRKKGRAVHARPLYTPNPRLYPGPRTKSKKAVHPKRSEGRGNDGHGRRHKRVFRRPVPNSRLYRPTPPRPSPPPAVPRTTWAPLPPHARLETASQVALRLSEQRRGTTAPQRTVQAVRASSLLAPPVQVPSRHLVVTLPEPRYRPASEHFQLRSLDTDSGATTPAAGLPPAMDAGTRHSTSPEDCSEGNEPLSAPSEFLAEFLSAIMRRQYAEALKYCRLILQYEPQNATARGFYPLLQHKVQAHKQAEAGGWARGSSSEEASLQADQQGHAASGGGQEMMEQGADESEGMSSRGSVASQSSLELDSSEAQSSPSLSLSGAAGESTGSEPDDNGNAPAPAARSADVQNDNALPASVPGRLQSDAAAAPLTSVPGRLQSDAAPLTSVPGRLQSDDAPLASLPGRLQNESASLRRLRAQFTCSIK